MYGKGERKNQLEQRILKLLSKLEEFDDQIDFEDDPNSISKLESKRERLKTRWKEYESELKALNELDEITMPPSAESKGSDLKDDKSQVIRPGNANRFNPDVAAALVQLAKAWAADQDKEAE